MKKLKNVRNLEVIICTPSLSFYIRTLCIHIQPQSLHTSGLILYNHPQPLLPASASTSGLSLYSQSQSQFIYYLFIINSKKSRYDSFVVFIPSVYHYRYAF